MADLMLQGQHDCRTIDKATDAVVIQRILQGQTNDFEIILDRYQRYVCALISRQVNAGMVLELAQEVFVEAYRSLPKYNQDKSFANWLAAITLHRCQDYWRRHYRSRETPISGLSAAQQQALTDLAEHTGNERIPEALERKEMEEILQVALAGLSPQERMIVTLVHLEERSIKEVATMLDWTVINVKVRAYRARRALKKRITALLAGDSQP